MLYNVRLLILFLAIISAVFLLLGLVRPWAMLWWEDTQNRKKIFKVYGSLALLFALLYYALQFLK